MIFKDKLGYIIKNETRNNTNTKKYDLLDGDFIFEATFKPDLSNPQNEFCVLGRTGYNMGIFSHGDKSIKWSWWKIENYFVVYDDLYFGSKDMDDVNQNHARWWKEYIIKNTPVNMKDVYVNSLVRRWGGGRRPAASCDFVMDDRVLTHSFSSSSFNGAYRAAMLESF